MDNNDSNIKSQQTGGLKLMTVFIAVLALHVVVIGGFTVYHLMSGGGTDADATAVIDKSHKDSTDSTATTDKSTTTTAAPTEVATIPANTVTPASAPAPTGDTVSPTVASNAAALAAATTPTSTASTPAIPAPAPVTPPALTLAQSTSAPATPASVANPGPQTPTGPIASALLPPSDQPAPMVAPAPAPMAPVVAPATSSLAAGPVHMPPANKDASRVTHAKEHEQIYTVKITDSYKKIAKAHHVTVAQLKEANGIKGDVLHTGQKLYIPSGKSEVAESASATSSLASAPTVLNASTAPMTTGLSSTSTSEVKAGEHHLYTIEKGDTLNKIAHKFKTTPSAIIAANGDLDPTKLKIGRKLHIPSRESRSAQNTVPIAQPVQAQQAQQAKSAVSTPATGELTSFSL
jgi:LysM repeat protein